MAMSSKEIGLREARAKLGDLVTAAMYGQTTIITRNGRPAARIAPLEETSMDTEIITDQVITTLGDHSGDFDVTAIVEEIGDTYGRDKVRSVDDVPSDEYWEIVRKHER